MLRELFSRTASGIKLGLETTRELLGALGSPHASGRYVVVGGTNGKGSTSALLEGALARSGHRVALYTSPHLLRFAERIRIEGRELGSERLHELYERVRRAASGCARPPTFFECVTAMALLAFAEARVDIAVLEVGLGGRLDATNVVDKLLSVVTPIDLDHQQYLGDTLEQIADEKAGIIASRGTVVVAPQRPEARAVLGRRALERGARLIDVPPARLEGGKLVIGAQELTQWLPGAYQEVNVATAHAACRALGELGLDISDEAFARAAAETRWAGRYDWLAPDLLVDGAHNPAGIAALLSALGRDPRVRGRPLYCVFSVLRDKAGEAMTAALAPHVGRFYTCPLPVRRARSQDELASLLPSAEPHRNAASAIDAARRAASADGGLVLVCGSLFLVAETLAHVTGEPRDPPIDA